MCGVNDMTFEEWERYQDQMLSYYRVYQYDNALYEEEDDENDSSDESSDELSEEDNEWDDYNDDSACLYDAPCIK